MGSTFDELTGRRMQRRNFLSGLAALGGTAAITAATPRAFAASELLKDKSAPATEPAFDPATLGEKGRVLNIRGEMREYKDPKTGGRVRRLTSDGSNNVHPYFTSNAFVGDNADRVLFISDRCGTYQWYMLEVSSGKLVQLTAGRKLGPNMGCVSRNGRLSYFDGDVLHTLKIDTLEDRELYRVPKGFWPGIPTCSADGHYVAFVYNVTMHLSTISGAMYSGMQEEYYRHPQSVVMRIDAASAQATAVWGDASMISHVGMHPTDPNLVLYCVDGGSAVVHQRMFMVDLSQKRARQSMPLCPQKPGECVVHEYFTLQGDVGFQYSIDHGETLEEFNAFVRPDGTWLRQYRFPGARPGHIQSNSDNTLCVGDCGYLGPKDKDGRNYIAVMTHNNGEVQVRRLAWHGTSWKTQESHPHPSFSPDNKWVVFNSDLENSHNVYMADVQSV